jgi:hypothetical protein
MTMEPSELATETLERHKHIEEHPQNDHAKRMGLLIGVLAACLAISEMGEKSAQNDYIAKQIQVTDTWNFYQAKAIKAELAAGQAKTLAALARLNNDPKLVQAAKLASQKAAKNLSDTTNGNGKAELRRQAEQETRERNHQLHLYHLLELAVGALQIAIVLASVSVITEIKSFSWASIALGASAFVGAAVVMGFL